MSLRQPRTETWRLAAHGASSAGIAILLIAAGCGSPPSAEDAELQALMHDEPLASATRGALTGAGGSGMVPAGAGGAVILPTGAGGSRMPPSGAGGIMLPGVGGEIPPPPPGAGGSFMTSPGIGGSFMTPPGAGGRGDVDAGTGGAVVDGGGRGGVGGSSDGGVGGGLPFGPLGHWTFDDCNGFRTNLFDSGPNGNTAFRSVSAACAPGIQGQGVALADKDNDIVYVPDQPSFMFDGGVTVAAWTNATSVSQTRTLFRKRDSDDNSSLALVLNGGKYQFVVKLASGKLVSVTAPSKAKPSVWTHVAGTYDGAVLRLYVNGAQVASQKAVGTIAPGAGPLLMGNDGSKRLFAGTIDEAFFDARALAASEILALNCLRQDPTLTATPATSPPTPNGQPATFDVAIQNNDSAACAPADYFFESFAFQPGLTINPSFSSVPQVPAGGTAHVTMTVTASDDLDPGTFNIPLELFGQNPPRNVQTTSVNFVLISNGCRVSTPRELMIKDLSVVDDPVRTTWTNPGDPRTGAWTFKRLVENMAPTPADAPAMVEAMLRTFTTTQTINGFTVDPRPGMQTQILDNWPRSPDGSLDLTQPPLQLQAIVNRFDLRNLAEGNAGEGRFVFAFVQQFSGFTFPFQATMIFEYKLPATTAQDVQDWANAWHALGSQPFPSEAYNTALQAITDRFNGRGARPGAPNGNAINAVRTNEIDFGDNGIWQLREFNLSPTTGRLEPATIKLTPDRGFNNSDTLASFINANAASIIAETHTVPEQFQGQPFLAGAVFNDLSSWFAPGIADNEARFHFAVNTCNGCHSSQETGTFFLQITPRSFGSEAFLSGFLTGTTVSDPVTGQPRSFNDLQRRASDLKAIVCPAAPPPTPMVPGGPVPVPGAPARTTLEKGISRVH
jgi:hypothetical protein